MDRLLPLSRVARLLAVPQATVRDWVQTGAFPAPIVLPGGRERWRYSVVMAWLQSLTPACASVTPRLTPEVTPSDANEPGVSEQGLRLDPLSWSILHALADGSAWISGAELAESIGEDLDHRSGGFSRASRRLRDLGLIETSRTHGYRATESGAYASLRQRDANEPGDSLSSTTA